MLDLILSDRNVGGPERRYQPIRPPESSDASADPTQDTEPSSQHLMIKTEVAGSKQSKQAEQNSLHLIRITGKTRLSSIKIKYKTFFWK